MGTVEILVTEFSGQAFPDAVNCIKKTVPCHLREYTVFGLTGSKATVVNMHYNFFPTRHLAGKLSACMHGYEEQGDFYPYWDQWLWFMEWALLIMWGKYISNLHCFFLL